MSPLPQMPRAAAPDDRFELRFEPLLRLARPLAFACDAAGAVDLDALADDERRDYLFAHTLIGRDYASPTVRRIRRALASARPSYVESPA